MRNLCRSLCVLIVLWSLLWAQAVAQPAIRPAGQLQAGAVAVDVTPTQAESIVAGQFLEVRSSTITDRLYARAIVLANGQTEMALVVVDTCMMPTDLIVKARQLAQQRCGIPVQHITISATHTHSAPAAMGCLGTRLDSQYAALLPIKIADAICDAHSRLQPARIGWSSIDDWEHTHNRRWIRKPEAMIVDPFGKATGRAHMHPGYRSRDVIGPSGPVDPELSLVSVQSRDGKPLALLANYSQHYFGSKPISADYFGLFAKDMAERLGQSGDGNGPFVCAMSQGTSGDLMWMDYGSPAKQFTTQAYATAVADYASKALQTIQYQDRVELGVVEKTLTLDYRVPDAARLAWAKPIAEKIVDDLPKSLPEVYAREALILHERQSTTIHLQALRIGDLTIATLPNEVYALTGLKLKLRSPGESHFNIELAGGAEGYIPPPEQHALGGYTTWPARTAGLEVNAEPKIVETLLTALEEVTGKPRRKDKDQHGPYAQALIEQRPVAYWRMNEADGRVANSAVPSDYQARLEGGFAWYLPGAGSGTGTGAGEYLKPTAFSGSNQINRSVHLADGKLCIDKAVGNEFTLSFWFWLGEASGASPRSGCLCRLPSGAKLMAVQDQEHRLQLKWQLSDEQANDPPAKSNEEFTKAADGLGRPSYGWADDWHNVTIIAGAEQCRVVFDGRISDATNNLTAALTMPASLAKGSGMIALGEGLQGKLDEIALFDRALDNEAVRALWQLSDIELDHKRAVFARQRSIANNSSDGRNADGHVPATFAPGYRATIEALRPVMLAVMDQRPTELESSKQISFSPNGFADGRDGRMSGAWKADPARFSLSLWFVNRTANSAQAVTGYLASRGTEGDRAAPGDHLGIGGTYRDSWTGKLILFNGNQRDEVLAGRTTITPGQWHHVVWIRDGQHVKLYLDGQDSPEIDGQLTLTDAENRQLFLASRSDNFAPLNGQLAYLALFDRALSPQESKTLYTAAALPVTVDNKSVVNASKSGPASEPMSPEDSLAALHVARGFRAELMAAEPIVLDPVAFDWDIRGRLWVVEMADYPLGMDGKGKPGGRVRILQDRDGDGRYDESKLFADGLNFPNGIMTWRDGVLITAAPQILYLRDTDGDDKADQTEVLFEGFQQGNQQLRLNGLRYGLDNWVYCANGGHHANYGLGTKVTSRKLGQSFEIGSRDFRIQPDTGQLALESGPSQYGRNRDAWGHWFGVQNAKPLWHYVIPDRYLARNPHVPAAAPIHFVLPPGSPPVYPASLPEKRYHSFNEAGHFTSACSGMIYNDRLLFGATDRLHAFTCEPFHNLIQHNVLADEGVTFTASRPVGEGKFDFFASEDRWSRPVMVRTGPDGALWVADMYRYMIEHPDWLPPAGKEDLLPHYRLGDDKGRIYRIVPDNLASRRPWAFPDTKVTTLVAAMDSTNDWQRDKAQQQLLWNIDKAAIPLLLKLSIKSPIAEARGQALATLSAMGALEPERLGDARHDASARVTELAIRLSEEQPGEAIVPALTSLTKAPDPKVCLQLALTLGQFEDRQAGEALVRLARRFPNDPFLRSAIMSSALVHARTFAEGLATSAPEVQNAFREPLLRQAIGAGDAELIALMFDKAISIDMPPNCESLDGLLLVLERLGTSLEKLESIDQAKLLTAQRVRVLAMAEQLAAIMGDTNRPIADRMAAARTLSRLEKYRASAIEQLASALSPNVDPEVQQRALQALGQSADASVPVQLAKAWSTLTPALRAQALDVWTARAASTADLLERMEKGEIKPGSLDLTQRTFLMRYPNAKLAERAKAIFGQIDGTSKRQTVLDQYQAALSLAAKPERGQQVYKRACANCHRRGNSGNEVGPNLATVINHPKEKLLRNILDPNADIQPGYQAYTCLLDSGEILSGLLAGETSISLSIKAAGGELRTITRAEIEKLQNLNVSFMPEGLEANITQQEMADLLAYLVGPIEK